ncbi:MAG: hypothetical protein NTX79_04270 [Candidatus Micrarchaeota archaeon]|nr:hypothetical protein [Candidatus Micrarchaeota archaeon]
MPKSANYADTEILLALIWTMPRRMTKGQLGRILGIKSAGQKHWRERLEKLGKKNLLSIETLNTGELFFGSPILKYYLTEENLEAIWLQYFINDNQRNGVGIDPYLLPFSVGIWNVTSSPGFCKLIGSKFNYHFLCAKNVATSINPMESIKAVSKDKVLAIIDAVLSVCWEIEAYRRKPALMDTLTPEQKKTYSTITTLYEKQIRAHPADYKRFAELVKKSFRTHI